MDQIVKRSNELFPIYVDYSTILANIELIQSYTVVCVNTETAADTKATIVASDINDDPKVKITIQGGIDKEQHKITVVMTTTGSHIYEKDILIVINDDPVFSFSKQPSEQISFSVDFVDELETSDSLASVDATISDLEGVDLTVTMILIDPSYEDTRAVVTVSVGTKGEDYICVVSGTTTAGYVYSKAILIHIEEI